MRNLLTITAIAAGIATAAGASTPTTSRHHHSTRADNQSAEVRALNEKSLQQASAGMPMTGQMAQSTMSDSGASARSSGMSSSAGSTPQ
jgi:hypothetical protein